MAVHIPPVTWLRNNKDIARFLGLKQKPAQLAEIGRWIKDPSFPAKQRKGWPAEAVRQWVFANCQSAKGITRLKVRAGDLPPQDKPAGDELFEPDGAGLERTLDVWQDKLENPLKWERAPILSWQLKKLEARRPHLFPNKASATTENGNGNAEGHRPPLQQNGLPNHVGEVRGPTHMGVILSKHYAGLGLRVTKNDILWWENGDRLWPGMTRKSPQRDPGRSGWNNPKPYFQWFYDSAVLPAITPSGQGQPDLLGLTIKASQLAELNDKINREKISKLEADNKERELSAKYILRDEAQSAVNGALKKHHVFTKNQLERGFKTGVTGRLRGNGFTEAQLLRIAEVCAAMGKEIIKAIEEDCCAGAANDQ